MADDHMRAPDGLEHRRGNSSGVSAFLLPENVLSAYGDLAVAHRVYYGRNAYKGWTENDLIARMFPHVWEKRGNKRLCLFRRLVHLPIGGDQFLSHSGTVSELISKLGKSLRRPSAVRAYALYVR